MAPVETSKDMNTCSDDQDEYEEEEDQDEPITRPTPKPESKRRARKPKVSLARVKQLAERYQRNFKKAEQAAETSDPIPAGQYQVEQILCDFEEFCLVKWFGDDLPTWEPLANMGDKMVYKTQGSITLAEYDAWLEYFGKWSNE